MITFLIIDGNDDATGSMIYPPVMELAGECRALRWRADNPREFLLVEYRRGREVSATAYDRGLLECILLDASALVVWNGMIPELRAQAMSTARKIDLPVAFMELSPWADYLQCDPRGVNGYSSAAGLPTAFFAGVEPAGDIEETAWRVPPAGFGERLPALPEKTIFFPCQVIEDTQMIYHLHGYSGMEDVFNAVATSLPAGYTLLAKEHPAGMKQDRKAYPRMRERFPRVSWCKNVPIPDIFRAARGVVTVNSSVGLQAMQAGLRVLAIGRDAWIKAGLVSRPCGAGLATDIAMMLKSRPKQDLRRRFLTWLRDSCYVRREPGAILRRIEEIAAGACL